MPNWLAHLYAWLGILISVAGASLTVWQANVAARAARAAQSSADAAAIASKQAKARIDAIDWVMHFSDMTKVIAGLLERVDANTDWVRVSSECTSLRTDAVLAENSPAVRFDELLVKRFKRLNSGLNAIVVQANKKVSNSESVVDILKIRHTLSESHTTFSIALKNARDIASKEMENA